MHINVHVTMHLYLRSHVPTSRNNDRKLFRKYSFRKEQRKVKVQKDRNVTRSARVGRKRRGREGGK
jgi:hypothetical protein